MAELAELLEADRLVTLTGAPGVGKTRLALRVAAEVRARFADGVWLVELAPLAESSLVPAAIARALGLLDATSRPPVDVLRMYLAGRQALLVLDNCEHLLGACAPLVGELLAACPSLRVLATSREPLGLIGEVAWSVPSLTLPTIDDGRWTMERHREHRPSSIVHLLLESEAGRLFAERARSVQPGFEMTPRNAAAAAEICRRLDGIPLAIELAAMRLRTLSAGEIAARLDDRFALLTGGSRTALPRHRTLRAAIDWSHGLLSEPERTLLRRLAVFAGGWTLEAAEAVTGLRTEDSGLSGSDYSALSPQSSVLDGLASLVDKSLVLAEERGGGVRYRMLETVREYAAERLREAGEDEAFRARHREWFVAFVERAAGYLRGPEQAGWRRRLEGEHDNLRAALRYAIDRDDAESGLRLGIAIWHFWIDHGYTAEGRSWLEELLRLESARGRTAIRAAGLFVAAKLAFDGADLGAALVRSEESLEIAREVGDPHTLHRVLTQLGHIARGRGDLAAARVYYEEGLPIRRELGEPVDLAVSLACLGRVARARGDYDTARALYEESLELAERQGHPAEITCAQHDLGLLAHQQGRHDEAAAWFARALPVAHAINHPRRTAYLLEGFAAIAAAVDQPRRALQLAGAAEALRQPSGSRLSPSERVELDRLLRPAWSRLGEERAAAEWRMGSTMSADEAVTLALRPALTSGSDGIDALTRREREVAAMIGRGATNREVAESLVVSERTVEWHVTNVLGKLAVQTRAQVAVWAAEHGLQPAD